MGYRISETITRKGARRVRWTSTGHNGQTVADRNKKKEAALERLKNDSKI